MVAAAEFNETGAGKVRSNVAAVLNRHEAVVRSMEDQGGHPDRRQNGAHVRPKRHALQRH